MKVIKRDGREVEFNKQRIREALFNAFQDVDGELTESASRKASEIANYIEKLDKESMSVEEIQNIVEEKLMASNRKDVARAYILYRDKRNRVRQYNTKLMKDYKEKIEASNVVNQNANVDEHSFGGRIGEAGSMVLKDYALNNCMSEMARNNHLNNEIYIHDLDSYAVGMHNCLSVPFDDLLANGFKTRQTDVRPANSVNTAMQLVAVLFQLQSLQQFGGVSATHLDWTMIPYVRKSFYKHFKDGLIYISQWNETAAEGFRLVCVEEDRGIDDDKYFKRIGINSATYKYAMDMTEKELEQAVEGLYHNLNY